MAPLEAVPLRPAAERRIRDAIRAELRRVRVSLAEAALHGGFAVGAVLWALGAVSGRPAGGAVSACRRSPRDREVRAPRRAVAPPRRRAGRGDARGGTLLPAGGFMRSLVFPLVAFLLAACAPRTPVVFEMPAELTVPTEVRSLAVVDRGRSDASAAARAALEAELAGGARFRVAEAGPAETALGQAQGTVGAPLDAAAIAAARTAAGADGVVVVEGVGTGERWSYADRTETRTRTEYRRPADCASCAETATEVTEEVPVIDATVTVEVRVGYALYGLDGAPIDVWTETLGDARVGTGETQDAARSAAGDPAALTVELAESTAVDAARHLAPWRTTAQRRWYAAGGPEVAAGARHAREGEWASAEKAWRKGRKTASADTKGRVLFNLAVAAERRGDLSAALALVKEARPLLRNAKPADAYLEDLRARRRQARTLAAQMAPPPAED